MPNRKNRAKKGIESTKKSIEEHKIKIEDALGGGNEERAGYHQKEIEGMLDQIRKKEKILKKRK